VGPSGIAPLAVSFDLNATGLGAAGTTNDVVVALPTGIRQRRKYRRSEKSKGPRTYRSRPDPFADVWTEVCDWLTAEPERNGRSVFDELQDRYPGKFADGQLRTLQRHIQVWRAGTVLKFGDDGWLDDVEQTGQTLPPPLLVSADLDDDTEQSA
jgi:hypothetical protein